MLLLLRSALSQTAVTVWPGPLTLLCSYAALLGINCLTESEHSWVQVSRVIVGSDCHWDITTEEINSRAPAPTVFIITDAQISTFR
jgi:hypothetical protein